MKVKRLNKQSGFTLLEVIIVIIIIGVLASLALPRFFATVEFSRSKEALDQLSAIRQSVERCGVFTSGDYTTCTINAIDYNALDVSGATHFTYAVSGDANGYVITATRNGTDDSTNAVNSVITLTYDGTNVTRGGNGVYAGIQ